MKAIRFLARVSLYNPGEVAGFEEGIANAYIDAGVAEVYTVPTAAPPATPEDPDDPRHDIMAFSKGTDRKSGHRRLGK